MNDLSIRGLGVGRRFGQGVVPARPGTAAGPPPPLKLAGGNGRALERSALESELGATGTAFFRGLLDNDEFNPDLRGTKAAEIYEEMRRSDGQVRSILQALKLPILSAEWFVECEDEKVKAFLEEALFGRIDWDGFLHHALLCLDFGYEVLEKVYELDQGKIWLKKLAHRGQQTIYEWKVDEAGDLAGIVQQVWKGGKYETPTIPAEKVFLLVLDQDGNNFEGISILRSAYKHWFIKDNVYKVDAIAHERMGIGVPTMTLPQGFAPQDKTAAETICEEFRAGEKAGVVLPPGYVFTITGAGEGTRYDPHPTIRHHDEMIARGPLAMFLNLGTTETGARALAEPFMKLFLDSEWGLANLIRKEVKRSLIRPLLELNFANAKGIKVDLGCSGIGALSIEAAARAASALSLAGFIRPDDEIEDYFRAGLEMPARPKKEPTKATERRSGIRRLRRFTQIKNHSHHAHLADVEIATGPEGFWRALTEPEKAMALREISGRQDDARQHITDLVGRVKGRWVESLKGQVAEKLSDGDPTDIEDIALPPELMKPLLNATVDTFRDLYRYGKRTVQEEAKRQKKQARLTEAIALRDEPPEPEEVSKMFLVRGRQFLSRLSQKVENRAKDLALTLFRTKKADFTDAELDDLASEILSTAETGARLEASVLVSEAFNMGRQAEAEIRKEDIEVAVYSAILDESVCETCQPLDGEEFDVGTEEYYESAPPNKDCLGGDRCRCLYVYIMKD